MGRNRADGPGDVDFLVVTGDHHREDGALSYDACRWAGDYHTSGLEWGKLEGLNMEQLADLYWRCVKYAPIHKTLEVDVLNAMVGRRGVTRYSLSTWHDGADFAKRK